MDENVKFNAQTKYMSRKASETRRTLARISNCLTNVEKILLLNSVTKSQFSYAPCYCCRSLPFR